MYDYQSCRTTAPRLLEEVLYQIIDNCWSIALSRQLTALGRSLGILDDKETLSIQYLLNGVKKEHLTGNGAIDHLLSAKPFLVNEGTVLERCCPTTSSLGVANEALENATKFKVGDLIVHRAEDYENPKKFQDDIMRCLSKYRSPIAVAVPLYESFGNIGSEVYFPRTGEVFLNMFHVMLLTGIGSLNGVNYWELQDSAGKQRGEEGFIKVSMDTPVLSHMVEIKGLYCVPTNPYSIFMPTTFMLHQFYNFYIEARRAHCRMLAKEGLITECDKGAILNGLDVVGLQVASDSLTLASVPEDVHVLIEAALAGSIGDISKKLHRGGSVIDQCTTVSRLWCRTYIGDIVVKIRSLQKELVKLALRNKDLVIPTNLQKAQFVSLSQILLAYVEQLDRDVTRYVECQTRLNICPLGSCDLAGSFLPINTRDVAQALDFSGPMRNSIDAVTDRDFVVDLLHANSSTAIHLSLFAGDFLFWASEKCGFINPSGSASTGWCIYQQKYPHPMEVVRRKVDTVKGCLNTGLNCSAPSPVTYNHEFQDDLRNLFDSQFTTTGMIVLCEQFIRRVTFNQDRIKKSLSGGHLSDVTFVTYLVKKVIEKSAIFFSQIQQDNKHKFSFASKGLTEIQSLDMSDNIVGFCVSEGRTIESVTVEELKHHWPNYFGDDLNEYMNFENSVNLFCSAGSTCSPSVDTQLSYWRDKLNMPNPMTI